MKRGFPLLIATLMIGAALPAQVTVVPQGFKYQAVARDAANKPYVNTDIRLAAALKDGGLLGTVYYEEEHDVTTTDLGMINLIIGQGMPVSGSFDAVPWAGGQINIVIRISLDDGFTWTPMGESPLLSVPYAQIAETAHALVDAPGFIEDSLGLTGVSTLEEPGKISFIMNGFSRANLILRSTLFLPTFEIYDDTDGENMGIGVGALGGFKVGAIGNTAIGYYTLSANTSGNFNTAVGSSVLNQNVSGIENTAIGAYSLVSNRTGSYNTALGSAIMQYSTTGSRNTSVGFQSMQNNLTGGENTALGVESLNANKTGGFNTAIGLDAMRSNETGSHNVAVGCAALRNTLGISAQVAVGDSALFHNTTGYTNTALGYGAGLQITEGFGNTAVGFLALQNNVNGHFNTALGREAGPHFNNPINTTALGAGAQPTASNQVIIGNSSVTKIGGYTNWSNLSDSRFKLDIQENVSGLEFIRQLRPVTYLLDMPALSGALQEDRLARSSVGEQDAEAVALLAKLHAIKGQIRYSGFIAQDVEKAAAQVGYDFSGVDKPQNEEDFYALRYAEFVVPLVKAVQEQQAQIEALQAENEQLKAAVGEIETLRAAIEELQRAQRPK